MIIRNSLPQGTEQDVDYKVSGGAPPDDPSLDEWHKLDQGQQVTIDDLPPTGSQWWVCFRNVRGEPPNDRALWEQCVAADASATVILTDLPAITGGIPGS